MSGKPRVSVKERKLINGVIKGKGITQSAKDAGYSPHSASAIGCRVLQKPAVQSALIQAMEKAGITDDKIAETLKDAMDAEIPTKLGSIPDFNSRLKAVDISIKVKGGYAPDKLAVAVGTLADFLSKIPDDEIV